MAKSIEEKIEDIAKKQLDKFGVEYRKIDTMPTEADFRKTVSDYLSWKLSTIIKEDAANFQ
ncbi:MAG: hypothetical protein MJZ78_05380 [Bacteroidales bacterium]|nr:hypothetical protein [Bacteroidales bacterium]